jgi:chromosome segregation ATPase
LSSEDEDLVIVRNENNAVSIETKPTSELIVHEQPLFDTSVKAMKAEEETRLKSVEQDVVVNRALKESMEWEIQEAGIHSNEMKLQRRRLEKDIDTLTLEWKAAIKLRLKLVDENQKIEAATQSFKLKLDELVANNKEMEQTVRALETEKLKLENGVQVEEVNND